MVKQLALILLLCLTIQAHGTDALETAITNSDVEAVAALLNTPTISANELLRLIDLSQQVINQRKSTWEIAAMKTIKNNNDPEITQEDVEALEATCNILEIGLIGLLASIVITDCYDTFVARLSHTMSDFIGQGACLLLFGSIIWSFMHKKRK